MKIYNYTVFAVLLMTLFFVAGFDTSSSWVFSKLGLSNIEDLLSTTFWLTLASIFTIGTLGAVAIGSLVNISPTYSIKALYVMTPLVLLVLDFIWILNKMFSYGVTWIYYVILVILAPLIGGYAIALIEFWEGRD